MGMSFTWLNDMYKYPTCDHLFGPNPGLVARNWPTCFNLPCFRVRVGGFCVICVLNFCSPTISPTPRTCFTSALPLAEPLWEPPADAVLSPPPRLKKKSKHGSRTIKKHWVVAFWRWWCLNTSQGQWPMLGDGSFYVCFNVVLVCFTLPYPLVAPPSRIELTLFFIVPQNQTTGCRREIRHPDPHRPTRQGSRRRDSTHQSTHAQFDVHCHSAPRSVCWKVV